MDHKLVATLRAQGCGLLHWSPPRELHRELDGSKYGGDRIGFQIREWGNGQPPAPRIVHESLTFAQALTIARWQDAHLKFESRTRGVNGCEAWVLAIIAALAQVLDEAVETATERTIQLREMRANAQGMTVQLGAHADEDGPDEGSKVPGIPF